MNPQEYLLPKTYLPDDYSKNYLDGHLDRFIYQVGLFERKISPPVARVYDLGTWQPFSSFYFYQKYGAEVVFGCYKKGIPINSNVRNITINLCEENQPLEPADVVIATEILEHLPCNLYKVVDYLASAIKPGGHLLLSFPTGPIGNDIGYGEDLTGQYDRSIEHAHIREFPIPKAREFYGRIAGFKLIEESCIKTALYHHADGILHALLRKT